MKVLLVGESWTTFSTHVKGFDTFTTSVYEEGGTEFIKAVRSHGDELDFMPNHLAPTEFPTTLEQLSGYDAVVLSDIGANTLLLPPAVFVGQQRFPNRLKLLEQWVISGGNLMMVGGYLSFQGIEGKANYHNSPIEQLLPVTMQTGDDRVESPEGLHPRVENNEFFTGIDDEWPCILGYQSVRPKDDSDLILSVEETGDPLLVVGRYGQGRTAAFTSDMGPHWLSAEFMGWKHYPALWNAILTWMTQR
ncbi:glutamine amidotransferase [Bifidobacterium psychraerophilum]|uniref:glutamine amidotransferase n=1 Tax=Bifidobacterium psychraerophilum TaxID=218140 RepID=UPI0031114394